MHIFINHELRRVLITFPKVAGSSIEGNLLWKPTRNIQPHPNITGWKQLQGDDFETYFNLNTIKAKIPKGYQCTLMYRDPLERYISGFNFLFLDVTQMDMITMSQDSADDSVTAILEKWNKFDDEWYARWINRLFEYSNYNPGFNDNHTTNIMLVVWILWWELNAQLLYIDDLDAWIKTIHNLPKDFVLDRENVSADGYHHKSRRDIVKLASGKFSTALKEHPLLGDYLKIDRYLFDYLHNRQTKAKADFEKMSLRIADDLFSSGFPGGSDMFTDHKTMHSKYMKAMVTWATHGSTMSDDIKKRINTHISIIMKRYTHLTLSTGDTDV